jgi:hypothetical protein
MHAPLKYDAFVTADGRIDLPVPLPSGSPVTVIVVAGDEDDFSDLVAAAESSMGFWDNPWDDEDWNNA